MFLSKICLQSLILNLVLEIQASESTYFLITRTQKSFLVVAVHGLACDSEWLEEFSRREKEWQERQTILFLLRLSPYVLLGCKGACSSQTQRQIQHSLIVICLA
jgi:hypothetical protein